MTSETKGYDRTSRVLHWSVAAIVIGLFASGFWMVDLSYYSSWYRTAPFWHKSVGVLLFLMMGYRVLWRLLNGTATPVASHSKAVQRVRISVNPISDSGVIRSPANRSFS